MSEKRMWAAFEDYLNGPATKRINETGWTFDNASDRALVQAAPDLLEALRSALFWLGKPEEDRLDDAAFQMFCDWARETVARAEGGDEQ